LTEWGDRRVLDSESLDKVFGHMADRLETVGVRLFLAVLRSEKAAEQPREKAAEQPHEKAAEQPHEKAAEQPRDGLPLLKSILAATRALDRVGQLRSGDFVVLMPGIDERAAISRAHLILTELEEGLGEPDARCRDVTVGLTRVEPGVSFSEAVAVSSAAATEAADRGDGRLLFAGRAAVGT
jgi:hypothetical protein